MTAQTHAVANAAWAYTLVAAAVMTAIAAVIIWAYTP